MKASVLNRRGAMAAPRVWAKTQYPATPATILEALAELTDALPAFDRVSVGFPGVVREGTIVTAPHFGNDEWRGVDFARLLRRRFRRPTRVLNDADMQGWAAIEGQRLELVVTLGTGVGTSLFRDGVLMPHLEFAHHPVFQGQAYNQYVGDKALKRVGSRRWNRRVRRVLDTLRSLINYDRVHLGGGNAMKITFALDVDMRVVSNTAGILGGIALWRPRRPAQ